MMEVKNIDLAPEDFPLSVWARNAEDDKVIWAVTIFTPEPGTRVPLTVPPFAMESRAGVMIEILTGDGVRTRSGPYGELHD